MTTFIFANNINTTLAGAVSTSATTITLASTANLPTTIPAGSVLVITLNDAATRQNFEVVYATARTGATLTVLRAQEGTAALAWLTGDYAFSPPTAGQQQSFGQAAANNTWTGNNTFNDPVIVGNAIASGDAVNLGQFLASMSGSGYFELPIIISGTAYTAIVQWATSSITATGSGVTGQAITLTKPYPNLHAFCLANFVGGNPPSGGSCAGSAPNQSQAAVTINTQSAGTYGVQYISIGF